MRTWRIWIHFQGWGVLKRSPSSLSSRTFFFPPARQPSPALLCTNPSPAPALPSTHRQSYLPHAYTPYPCTPTPLLCTNPAACARLLHQLCTPEPSSPLERPALLYPTPCHTCASAAAPNQPLCRLPLSAPEPPALITPPCLLAASLHLYALITCLFPEPIASRSRTHYPL
ncbi:hypothetical protein SLEP1_g6724 [Rubroshorea leprosula]|uniref:Uncharacterized protein n=1 Tax=Rubroshorea leprosula TaxID=152421 RepID=A0AAV5I634_9ROSI|nr:hypothetical protein SLEP1_g6724 [Rubroshorea leprosula]